MSKDKPSSTKFACRKCKYILGEDDVKCPICGGTEMRMAAYICAINRVAEAMKVRGWV